MNSSSASCSESHSCECALPPSPIPNPGYNLRQAPVISRGSERGLSRSGAGVSWSQSDLLKTGGFRGLPSLAPHCLQQKSPAARHTVQASYNWPLSNTTPAACHFPTFSPLTMWRSWQGANLGHLLGPWALGPFTHAVPLREGSLFPPGSLPEPTCWVRSPSPSATVKVFTTCLVLSRQKGVLICPQELQGAKQGSLSQARARLMTGVALPGLGQTHSGYTHE